MSEILEECKFWGIGRIRDGSWQEGLAKFWHGENNETTIVSFGGNSSQRYITTYFKRRFFVGDPADNSDGTELVTVRLTPPPAAGSRWFVRLRVEQE